MLQIDRFSRKPIYEQIIERFEFLIAKGQLVSADAMPSIRSLSQELSVNPNTLQKAYTELERRGLCYTVPGSGRYVSENAKTLLEQNHAQYFTQLGEVLLNLQKINITQELVMEYIKKSYFAYNQSKENI